MPELGLAAFPGISRVDSYSCKEGLLAEMLRAGGEQTSELPWHSIFNPGTRQLGSQAVTAALLLCQECGMQCRKLVSHGESLTENWLQQPVLGVIALSVTADVTGRGRN